MLDDLMEEVKNRLVQEQIDKIKGELLAEVDKKQNQFLKDVVDICDNIFGDFVQASEKSKFEVTEMIKHGKQEMFSPLRFEVMEGMVRDEVRLQLDKLQLRMVEKMQEQVKLHVDQLKVKMEEKEQEPQDTRHPANLRICMYIYLENVWFKTNLLRRLPPVSYTHLTLPTNREV